MGHSGGQENHARFDPIGAQLGAIVAGGFTPFIAKGLAALDHDDWSYVAS